MQLKLRSKLTRITFVNYETTSWYRVGKKSKPPTHFSPLFHPERKFWKGRRLRDGWQNDTRIRERCQTFSVLETRGGGPRALETEFYSRDGCRSFCLRYRCWQQAIRIVEADTGKGCRWILFNWERLRIAKVVAKCSGAAWENFIVALNLREELGRKVKLIYLYILYTMLITR